MQVDPAVKAALHEAYWQGHFRNRLLFDELRQIAADATAEGIALMPLKGACLARGSIRRPRCAR